MQQNLLANPSYRSGGEYNTPAIIFVILHLKEINRHSRKEETTNGIVITSFLLNRNKNCTSSSVLCHSEKCAAQWGGMLKFVFFNFVAKTKDEFNFFFFYIIKCSSNGSFVVSIKMP